MNIKEIMLKKESLYSKYACFDKDAIRLRPYDDDIRPNFFRDIDRIIHTPSYTRYMDKTQVFIRKQNDHISKRMTHVQLVSKIARTIGRALSLNEDLIEAIALGHDLGHTPFGHEGEYVLDEISRKNNEGPFMHNVQSVRNIMILENKNISLQVLDGILCHNGEFLMKEYYPKKKTVEDFFHDYNSCLKDAAYGKTLVPMTLEGCVVRLSDIIGYLGRDIEDAVRLGVFDINNLPKPITKLVGKSNKEIINNVILDVITNSIDKPYLRLSDDIYTAIKDLKKFNYDNIYHKAHTKEELDNYRKMFHELFDALMIILEKEDRSQNIFTHFLDSRTDEYLKTNSNTRKIIDYIAGMTDEYFINEYNATLKADD